MLYWGLDEQARHEHMSDEYKDRYIIQCCRNPHPGYIRPTRKITTLVPTELNLEGKLRQNKGSPKYV